MADLTFTTIEEPARAALEITRDDYALCNYIQTWSSHPGNNQPGYCDRTRQQMADFIGITTRGTMKMLDRLERLGLVERMSEKRFLHRITTRWFDTVTLAKAERKGEQSSPIKENKVPYKGEQSSPMKENKVPPHKDIYKEYKDFNKEGKNACANAPLSPPFKKTDEFLYLEEKEKTPSPQVAPAPPPQTGAAIRLTIHDGETLTVHEQMPIAPQTPPVETRRTKPKNPRCQTADEIELAERTIAYLNQKAGRSFRVNAGENAKGIIARLREGFSEADMRQVIDFKTATWGNEPTMYEHLNPVTLFRPCNFEKYLQAAKAAKPTSGQTAHLQRSKVVSFGGDFNKYQEKQKF